MSKTRNVLKNISVGVAQRERKCYADQKHKIQPGENFLLDGQDGICLLCAGKVLDVAQDHLTGIRKTLGV